MLSRFKKAVFPLLSMAFLGFTGPVFGQGDNPLAASACLDQPRIRAIQLEAAKTDAEWNARDTADSVHRSKDLPDWQFSGLYRQSKLVFLSAEFSHGSLVRRESYYFSGDRIIFVSVDTSWDVDDPRKAPAPEKRQDFYFGPEQTFCHVRRTYSSRPVSHSDTTPAASAGFQKRADIITAILSSTAPDESMAAPLEDFPEADPPKP